MEIWTILNIKFVPTWLSNLYTRFGGFLTLGIIGLSITVDTDQMTKIFVEVALKCEEKVCSTLFYNK